MSMDEGTSGDPESPMSMIVHDDVSPSSLCNDDACEVDPQVEDHNYACEVGDDENDENVPPPIVVWTADDAAKFWADYG